LTDNKDSNPFFGLPFIPGNQPLSTNTLPEFALHTTAAGVTNYNFNLHAKFGTSLA
jgi:hypothetical protein